MIDEQVVHPAFASVLSPRELAVLERLANGLPNRDIARELEITVNTVKFHLASIYRKLGVENRTEASVAFVRHYVMQPTRDTNGGERTVTT
jgi:DNA-binding NarL/FixJ family response regulator